MISGGGPTSEPLNREPLNPPLGLKMASCVQNITQ